MQHISSRKKLLRHRNTPLLVTFSIYLICVIVTLAVGGSKQDTEATHKEEATVEIREQEIVTTGFVELEATNSSLPVLYESICYDTETEELSTEETSEEDITEYTHTYYDIPLRYGLQDCVVYYLDYMNIDLDATYIYALIYHESRFNPNATGSSGDSGYVQILQKYWGEIYGGMIEDYPELAEAEGWMNDPYDEKTNIACGIYYLNEVALELTGEGVTVNNLSAALTGYNRGPNGAKNLYDSTGSYSSSYSRAVIDISHIIQDNNGLSEELKTDL